LARRSARSAAASRSAAELIDLLAAVPADDVGHARGVHDAPCGLAQDGVSGRMPVGVVDRREVIDVEEQARTGRPWRAASATSVT
jgi:hypothetical protein